jgi:hypothetical protein
LVDWIRTGENVDKKTAEKSVDLFLKDIEKEREMAKKNLKKVV